jgi:LPS O-antigen subunit length determinant protein (WzzB/FepE family)
MDQPSLTHQSNPDEINLLEYLYILVKNKWLIIGLMISGLFTGYFAALIKGPTWVAETIIGPNESESANKSSASLGALGFLSSSKLLSGENPSMEKIMLLLDTKEFNAKLIDRFNLLPEIYRFRWPAQYKKYWDFSQKKWKNDFTKPNSLEIGSFIREQYLTHTVTKRNTLTITIRSKDSAFSATIANSYLIFLNEYIKTSTIKEAQENMAYLNTQLVSIADPLLREKVQELIATEIEKEMVVNNEVFNIFDPVYCYSDFKEKLIFPVFLGGGLLLLSFFTIIIGHAISSSKRSPEDILLINKMKAEFFTLFNKR